MIMDGCHNPQGIEASLSEIKTNDYSVLPYELIHEERVVELGNSVIDFVERKDLKVSFFDIITVMALLEFKE